MTAPTEVDEPRRVMLTVVEAARRLSIGRSTIYELIASGALESVHIGRLRRIPVESLAAFVEACRRNEQGHATASDVDVDVD
jgi:excisionase family DNA binding protein